MSRFNIKPTVRPSLPADVLNDLQNLNLSKEEMKIDLKPKNKPPKPPVFINSVFKLENIIRKDIE